MKNLVRSRRRGGWNLIEIIVAVAIGASIAAAGVVAYQGEAKKAALAKAKQFISQVEIKKASILTDVELGILTTLPTGSSLYSVVLTNMKVDGTRLWPNLTQVASVLGFASLTVGELDTVDPNTGIASGGTAASVTLNGGTTVTGGGTAVAGSY